MKKEDVEKYIANLSPELQKKAKACKNIGDIKKFIAENDIELPEDILESVFGESDCSASVGLSSDSTDTCNVAVTFNTNFKNLNKTEILPG